MLHAGVKLIDARPNPADGLTMTNLTYYLHNNRTKHKTAAQEHELHLIYPTPHIKELVVMLTDVLLLLSRALLDSEGLRIDRPTTKKTSSAFFLGNIV